MWRALPAWAATTELSCPLKSALQRRQPHTWKRSAPRLTPTGKPISKTALMASQQVLKVVRKGEGISVVA